MDLLLKRYLECISKSVRVDNLVIIFYGSLLNIKQVTHEDLHIGLNWSLRKLFSVRAIQINSNQTLF